ncbi:hypothetical protein LEP1GSC133_3068 [Leptospira borgpetersenii serovar Pomona str. 200901868]|uniref:Uncharacterized protein n=1 Tax=Leptospira borgpetersenii serovar Pomona str. 200901868 TaxID=1192866 RepID=M6WB38_LEPBO|nr:hypothetical protein LEP1GSC133_3068 [Leptospira borgpetersenii serovar Pomona str. 200901868]
MILRFRIYTFVQNFIEWKRSQKTSISNQKTKQSRIFSSIDFSIQEGDTCRNEYIDCHITVIRKKVNILSPKNVTLFRRNFLEFGFREKDESKI